jgi:hypothetical protein
MNAVALAYASGPASQSRHCEGAFHLLHQIDFRIVRSKEDRAAVGRLRYEAYLREGAINPSPLQCFTDPYDEDSNAWVFGLYIGAELASSIRLHVVTKNAPDSPSLAVFSDLLVPELEAGKTIIDPNRFVSDQRLARLYPALPYVTLRLCWLAAEYFDADHLLAAVRIEHQPFYRRLFGHRPICGPRSYPPLSKPLTLMTVDHRQAADRIYRRFPFVNSTYFERRMLFERYPSLIPAAIVPKPVHDAEPLLLARQAS